MMNPVKKHSYRFQVWARNAWGTVTSCDRCGVDHDHERCITYLRQQLGNWLATDHFAGAPMRIVDVATDSLLK